MSPPPTAPLLISATVALPRRPASATGTPALACPARTLPVALTEPGPADQAMRGPLCYRGSHELATVNLLVHRITRNHLHWNFRVRWERISTWRGDDHA